MNDEEEVRCFSEILDKFIDYIKLSDEENKKLLEDLDAHYTKMEKIHTDIGKTLSRFNVKMWLMVIFLIASFALLLINYLGFYVEISYA